MIALCGGRNGSEPSCRVRVSGRSPSQQLPDAEPRGRSPKGGSPQRPPRAPHKGPLKQFFKAMMAKRPSQIDLM